MSCQFHVSEQFGRLKLAGGVLHSWILQPLTRDVWEQLIPCQLSLNISLNISGKIKQRCLVTAFMSECQQFLNYRLSAGASSAEGVGIR